MNKELIKKYKKEFDHWLDGGKLLVFYSQDGTPSWLSPDEENPDDPWCFSEVLIVINDKYIEFRKALAEGKTIEKNYGSMGFGLPDKWDDFSTKFGKFSYDVECYRIKPDEPEFKAGDWVRHLQPYDEILPWREDLNTRAEEFELWQPQEGEWCWFYMEDHSPILMRYYGQEDWDIIEPFIGTLPSFLQN